MRIKNKTTNRSFGIVFFIVFLIVSLWPLLNNDQIRYWALFVSILFFLLGIINSKLLTPLNQTWFKFGLFLGKIISPFVMGIIFFLVVTPIGLLMRIIKKDLLNLRFNKNKSYWVEKGGPKSKMKNQF